MCMGILFDIYVTCMPGAYGGQKCASDPLGLKFRVTMWVLGIEEEPMLLTMKPSP